MIAHTTVLPSHTAVLSVIDVETWVCEVPATTGLPPGPRFGCSLAVHDGKLWVLGGGFGHDLARSGHDLHDVCYLDLATMEWRRPELKGGPDSPRYWEGGDRDHTCVGRCGQITPGVAGDFEMAA